MVEATPDPGLSAGPDAVLPRPGHREGHVSSQVGLDLADGDSLGSQASLVVAQVGNGAGRIPSAAMDLLFLPIGGVPSPVNMPVASLDVKVLPSLPARALVQRRFWLAPETGMSCLRAQRGREAGRRNQGYEPYRQAR
jgi:hypothetical protein